MLILIGIILILLLWIYIDLKKTKRKPVNRNYPLRYGSISFYMDGEDFFEEFLKEIGRAQSEIDINFYIIKNDRFSRDFLALLEKKAAEGIKVHLLLDFFGCLKIDRKSLKRIKQSGGQVRFSHLPKLPHPFLTLNVRNHRKMAVIDGYISYIGGFNVSKEYINQKPPLSPWRDYHLKIVGPIAKDFQAEFSDVWHKRVSKPFSGAQAGQLKLISYENGNMESEYLSYIGRAKNSIMIGSPYFFPTENIFNAIKYALTRGVQVRIIVPYLNDHFLVKEAAIPFFQELISEGATIYQYHKGFYHAKFIMVDDLFIEIGTANFNIRSFLTNDEVNLHITDLEIITQIHRKIQVDIADCKILTLSDMDNLSAWKKFKIKLAKPLMPYL